MKVFVGKNKRGIWRAALNRDKVAKLDNLMEVELPVIYDKVFMVQIYHGFDYLYESGRIIDVVQHSSTVYHSLRSLKKNDPLWLKTVAYVKEHPGEYFVDDFTIATMEGGEPFTYGDAMGDDFNMKAISIKIDKN